MSGAELSKAQLEQYRAHLRRILVERFDDNQTKLAKALGISGPSLNAHLHKHGGPKWPTVRALAQLMGVSADEVIGPETPGGALPMARRAPDPKDRYPARRAVLARESHLFSPVVLQYAMAKTFYDVEGWPERQWLRWLMTEQDSFEREGEEEYKASRRARERAEEERASAIQVEEQSGQRQGPRIAGKTKAKRDAP